MIHFHVISLFPEVVEDYCQVSILGKAQMNGLMRVSVYNPKDHTNPRTKGALPQRVDDKPYSGGPGMVLRLEPVIACVEQAVGRKRNVGYIHFKPRAEAFCTSMARAIVGESRLSKGAIRDIVIFCGRYEGIDSRIEEIFPGRIISMGDYVLTGGEIPAMSFIDTVSRQISGVLGDADSREEERTAAGKYYTRPESITFRTKTYQVPRVLLDGNHKEIEEWRKGNS